MVRDNPLLAGLFDEVLMVVGKIYVHDVDMIRVKGLEALIAYVQDLPKGIGVL
jgi:hypothetical protein